MKRKVIVVSEEVFEQVKKLKESMSPRPGRSTLSMSEVVAELAYWYEKNERK